MATLTIEIPDDVARRLGELAAAQHKTVEELALERLRALAETSGEDFIPGSPAAVLQALRSLPAVTREDVLELEQAIAAGRLPVRDEDIFPSGDPE